MIVNSTRIINKSPYLRNQRRFPEEMKELLIELDRSYIEIANTVNVRAIALFTMNRPSNTGQSWWFQGENTRKQSFRQIYPFNSAPATIPHSIPTTEFLYFSHCFGFYTDGTNYYGALFASNMGINNQITFYVNQSDIKILSTGTPPTIAQGYIVLEWITKN